MKMGFEMKALVFFMLFLVCGNGKNLAQSNEYVVESEQGIYEELTTYESVALATEFDPLWAYEFELEFPFPFYDSAYNRVIFDRSGYGAFTDNEDNSLFLFQYYSWAYDPFMGSSEIPSDVRFSHVQIDGRQAFVLQFTKVRIFADLFEDSLDTYLNFQLRLFDNGVIEVHFGDIHMDNNPTYAPGKGLYCFTSDEGIDTLEICGPYMGIANPLNEDDAIGVNGAYDDYSIVDDIYANFTVMPPSGWVIRFKPKTVATQDAKGKFEYLPIFPNPVDNYIHLPQSGGQVTITDIVGIRVYASTHADEDLDVAALSPGLYVVSFWSGNTLRTGKFLKL